MIKDMNHNTTKAKMSFPIYEQFIKTFETISGIKLVFRSTDGYINAGKMCNDHGKLFLNWFDAKRTKVFLTNLQKYVTKSGCDDEVEMIDLATLSDKTTGTYVHPLVAMHIAMWISPELIVYVTEIMYQLFMTGNVELVPRTIQDTEELRQDMIIVQSNTESVNEKQCKKMLEKYNELKKKDNLTSNRKKVHKFEVGNVFYLLSFDRTNPSYKFGITNDINKRLQTYRTSNPMTHVKYLMYTDDNENVENMFKKLCKSDKSLVYNSSELVCGELKAIIKDIETVTILSDAESRVCLQEELNMYNDIIENDEYILYGEKLKQPEEQIAGWEKPFKPNPVPFIEYDDNKNVIRKKCTKCCVIKAAVYFYKKQGRPGNLSSQCMLCTNTKDYVEITEKKCKKCDVTKPVKDFYPSRVSVDKYENTCATCRFPPSKLIKTKVESTDNYKSVNDPDIRELVKGMHSKVYVEYDDDKNVIKKSCGSCNLIKPLDKFAKKMGVIGNVDTTCIDCSDESNEYILQKQCIKCKTVKNVECFNACKRSTDGYNHMCIKCAYPVTKEDCVDKLNTFVTKNNRQIAIECDKDNNIVRKNCSTCKVVKPASEFYKQTGRLGGLSSKCKQCVNISQSKS